ncbi:MAG: sodium-dependent transporter [Hyphomonadaceae bacterium]|nr:sodium-dependent transporter [Hyphomonadaceae bacterium]
MAAIHGKTEHWGSRFGFIMAAVGSSVGLGNLWRFPFTAGENGGSAFIIIYLLCVILLGFPVLMAEYAVGRKGQRSAISGIRHISETEGKSGAWTLMGWIGALASLGIFSFYIVIAAWVFDYIPKAFGGEFASLEADAELIRASLGTAATAIQDQISSVKIDSTCSFVDDAGLITQIADTAEDGSAILREIRTGDVSACKFSHTVSSKLEIIAYLAAFVALNVFVVARGVKGGIETAATILMPTFFLILAGMVVFAFIVGDAASATSFLLTPDFSKVTFQTLLAAVGQAFFSLSVGSCLMITYGAYLDRETSIPSSSRLVASADTLVALIAGFAIFPIVFAFFGSNLEDGGPTLFFEAMPVAFGQMGNMGAIAGGAFFTLALFAAFTSSISLLEVGVSWLEDRPEISRAWGAVLLGAILFSLGVVYVYWGDLIGTVSFLTGDVLLPIGGILISLFAGWVLSRESLASELGHGPMLSFARLMMRYIVPIALGVILVFGILARF